jgi:uncharacterized protein (DUF2267 family)
MGLTKREYFAIHALQAIASGNRIQNPTDIARAAVEYADVLAQALDTRQVSTVKSQVPSTSNGEVIFHPSDSEIDRMEQFPTD